ncbi:uncharacterized protein Z518_08295 [Rhinocladiella mackenziei CBS 650.93]|uniref:Uncharacterized protein n=1 Tax=Rhinocladiella mackenziei CBS 650.93 TaxID=1442369 RepID=A0A0D2I940_9EURO|nr:uncharacterized protein Z518_08295 [Rhinocladiella mackenziei CBS 650.93]KIX02354.1 hypothetical protein Z518_08295 [Rhinocladiella mackenziei CBS 650.93]
MDGQHNAELQRVLAALNSYSSQAQHTSETTSSSVNESSDSSDIPRPSIIPGLGLLPPQNHKTPAPSPPITRQQTLTQQQRCPSPRPGDLRSKPSTPTVPDASTITTWPAALRHVTRYLVTNEQVATRIKHLISEQQKHERQWWAGREAIVERQRGRSGTSQQVSALLKSLGGKDVPVVPSDPNQIRAELDAYDKKVHAGLIAMAADFDRQLRAMGVPFYAIKHDLVVLEEGPEKPDAPQGRIDKGELRELQKRMLQTLEDLFTD